MLSVCLFSGLTVSLDNQLVCPLPGEAHLSNSQLSSFACSSLCVDEDSGTSLCPVWHALRCHPCSSHMWVVVLVRLCGCSFCHYQKTQSQLITIIPVLLAAQLGEEVCTVALFSECFQEFPHPTLPQNHLSSAHFHKTTRMWAEQGWHQSTCQTRQRKVSESSSLRKEHLHHAFSLRSEAELPQTPSVLT